MKSSNNASLKVPLLFFFAVMIISIGLTTAFFYYLHRNDDCVSPYEVKDSTSGKEIVRVCSGTFYHGGIKIVNNKEFPDLFGFSLGNQGKTSKIIYDKNNYEKAESLGKFWYGNVGVFIYFTGSVILFITILWRLFKSRS